MTIQKHWRRLCNQEVYKRLDDGIHRLWTDLGSSLKEAAPVAGYAAQEKISQPLSNVIWIGLRNPVSMIQLRKRRS